MRLIVNSPEPNTIALGAVATGSMKAKLALMVAGTISSAGSISFAIAIAARIGINNVAVAVLLVSSVKNVTARQINRTKINTGSACNPPIEFPSKALSPDDWNALAKHTPPANKIKIPQGIFRALSHWSNCPLRPPPRGQTNIAKAPSNATLASFAVSIENKPLQPPNGCLRVIQKTL